MSETWFLLFGGSSVDGRAGGCPYGPSYEGRTTERSVAREHYITIRSSPYSIGEVRIVTDDTYRLATDSDFGIARPGR